MKMETISKNRTVSLCQSITNLYQDRLAGRFRGPDSILELYMPVDLRAFTC
jgi:hypothetical protein